MNKLIFVNRFFHPDTSATSQLLSDLAFDLARQGVEVVVITSRSSYRRPRMELPAHESIDGVQVLRTATTHFGRTRLPGRVIDYLTFYLSGLWRLFQITRTGDVVVTMTDPPMLNQIGVPIALLRGARVISWYQDVFPGVASRAGLGHRLGSLGRATLRLLGWGAARAARHSDAAIVLSEAMAQEVRAMGAEPGRIRLISNWADLERVRPVAPMDNPLRRQWVPDDTFVIGYSGNMGVAHDLRPLLEAALRLRDRRDLRFVLIGDGQQREALEQQVHALGLDNVQFQDYQPRDRLHYSLSAIDLHVVSLRPEMEGLVVPSKFFGVAAAGRPTLFIGASDGAVARLIQTHDCGVQVAPEDVDDVVAQIERFAADRGLGDRMGAAARKLAEQEFSLGATTQRWLDLLAELGALPALTRHGEAKLHLTIP